MVRTLLIALAVTGIPTVPIISYQEKASVQSQETPETVARREIVRSYVEALNTQDKQKLTEFMEKYADGAAPAAVRAERSSVVASQGAPFKIIRFGADSAEAVLALVEDKNGERFTFQVMLSGGANPKLAAVRLTGPDTIDAKPPKDYSKWQSLPELVTAIQGDTDSPGMGIAVLRDGKTEVVVSGVRENGKSDAVQKDDIWSVGSIGKPICSTLVGKLIETGKLRWDTTLKEAFPDVPMAEGYERVTLEQVMKHRGGLPQDLGFRAPQVQAIVGTAKTPFEMRENYVKDVFARPPIAPPDTRFAYSNADYGILAHLVEMKMGKPYEEVVRESLFAPLGLKHSYIGEDTFPAARPSGHVGGPNGLTPRNMRGPLEALLVGAGSGIYMSVGDLATFGAAHMVGLQGKDGLLKASTIARLHDGVPDGGPSGMRYGCGWGIVSAPGVETRHGHNGSNGTFRAELAIYPKSNLVVVAIVNRGGEAEPSPSLQAVNAIARRYAKQ